MGFLDKVVDVLGFVEKEEVEEVATTKECPYCYTEIHLDATRCPNCTSKL